jgi:hypothetical protein
LPSYTFGTKKQVLIDYYGYFGGCRLEISYIPPGQEPSEYRQEVYLLPLAQEAIPQNEGAIAWRRAG